MSLNETDSLEHKFTTTLVQATERGNYEHWLTGIDIGSVMQVCYPVGKVGWADAAVNIVACKEQLKTLLLDLTVDVHPYVFILNVRNNHWVTLLVPATKKAYLFDSMGPGLNMASEYVETARDECKYECIDGSITQQMSDGYNCGIWCLLNLQSIQIWWLDRNNRNSICSLKKSLKKCSTLQEEVKFMREKRHEFCRQLEGIPDDRFMTHSVANISTSASSKTAENDDRSYSLEEIFAELASNKVRVHKQLSASQPTIIRNAASHKNLSCKTSEKNEMDTIVSLYAASVKKTIVRNRIRDEKIAADRSAEESTVPKKQRSVFSKNHLENK